MKNPPRKNVCDMSAAEKEEWRAETQRKIKRQRDALKKSDSGQILAAHTDGRESKPDGPEFNVATWALQQRGMPLAPRKSKLFVGMDEYAVRKLIEGDSAFFRKLADAMDYLARVGAVATENGFTMPLPYTVKSAILDLWDQWEKASDKIERRLAMLAERGYKISPSRYHTLVKKIGKK